MNGEPITLDALARIWHDVPRLVDVQAAADALISEMDAAQTAHTHEAFHCLLVRAQWALAAAAGEPTSREPIALGAAISALASVGRHHELLIAFTEGDAGSHEAIILALRDTWIADLQKHHHRLLLDTYCAAWPVRYALAREWLAQQDARRIGALRAWQLTECIADILDAVGAGERLLANLRAKRT
jgi:hypothetical protein